MRRSGLWVRLAPVAALLVTGSCGLANSGGFFEPTPPAGAVCERIPDFAGGTEDIVPGLQKGWFYVSADPRRDRRALAKENKPDRMRGEVHLLTFDTETGKAAVRPATIGAPEGFNPHGMSLWASEDPERRRLFVINHPPQQAPSVVEIFKVERNGDLTWLKTVPRHPKIHRPNDIQAVGEHAFYISNDHASRRGKRFGDRRPEENAEDLFAAPVSSVVFVDAAQQQVKAKTVARGLAWANGLAFSPKRNELYVTTTSGASLRVYRRMPDNTLKLQRFWPTGPGPDNLHLEADRRLWVASHNKALAVAAHGERPENLSPGRVEIMDPVTGRRTKVFETDGSELSAVSVAVPVGDKVLLGSILTPAVAVCLRTPG